MRRLTAVAILAGILVAGPAGVALAHECFVANRSAQGSESSANGNWFFITSDDILAIINEEAGLGLDLTDELNAAYRDAVAEAGLPTELAIFEHHTIGTNGANADSLAPAYTDGGHSGDGKGVDHVAFGGYVDQYVAVLFGLLGA